MAKSPAHTIRNAKKKTSQRSVDLAADLVISATDLNNETGASPVFIHSSFRTGSTWLWSKFRQEPHFYVYYEFYNEMLAKLDLATISHSDRDWYSRHPREAPYFLEFAPLLNETGGVRNYNSVMAFAEFFPAATTGENDLPAIQRDYVALLIDTARQAGRFPVLTCTRSLARIDRLKHVFGGLHLSLRRNLLHQWFSYSNQALNGNSYFIGTVIETILANTDDPVIVVLRRFIHDNRLPAATDASLRPNDNLFICFVVLHIYLNFLGARDADVVVDLGDLAAAGGRQARESLTATIRQHTGVDLEFSDAREVISAPMMLFADPSRIDLTVKSIFLMLRQTVAKDVAAFAHLADLASEQMSKIWEAYDRYCHFSGGAHTEIARMQKLLSPDLSNPGSVMSHECATLTTNLRDATNYAESLLASRDDIAADRDATRVELVAAASRADAFAATQERLERERDAALLHLMEMEAAMQQERQTLKAALDDASAYAANLSASYDAIAADRDATRIELDTAARRAEALAAAQEQLEGERDAALLRLTEAEAAMQQDLEALKVALNDARGEAEVNATKRETVEHELVALNCDAAAQHEERNTLAAELTNALCETERQNAAIAAAQQRIAALEEVLDTRIFEHPVEEDVFASRWSKMINSLK